tara:strand:- start:193 stop:447 length:255 start_codon:yes stop_codon:yes gene_type:complete
MQVIWALLFHILGPMITCYILWTVLVERFSTTIAAISVLTAPVVGVLSSAMLLNDTITWHKCIALTAIILSIAVATIGNARPTD